MSSETFPLALASLLVSEGGYCNDKQDKGGATNKGVTQREYDHWRAERGKPPRSVRQIEQVEVEGVYRSDYWNPVRANDLPSGVDYCVFDFAVNSSPSRAVRFLQRAVGVMDDGAIGPVTLAAAKAHDPVETIKAICSARLAYMKQLKNWPHFGGGWEKRVKSVQLEATRLAA